MHLNIRWSTAAAATILGLAFAWAYGRVLAALVRDWATDDNYSHGFFIVPLALYFAWERRDRLAAAERRPSWAGLLLVLGSLGMLVAGTLGAELFLARTSLVGLAAGMTLFVWGRGHLRILAFPIAFLLLMIPLPAIVFNQIAFPLQLLASRVGEAALRIAGIPVLREGNLIVLASTTLEVAEACSGIRSLISLFTLGTVLAYFTEPRPWLRVAIAASTIPVAVATNGLRVAGTGIAAHMMGPEAATGFLHTFSGWLMFGLAFGMLMAVQRALSLLAPSQRLDPSYGS